MSSESLSMLFRLLRGAATIKELQDLLKSVGVPSSAANWDDLLEKRVARALRSRSLNELTLLSFLGEKEEFGKQHVFLFERSRDLPSEKTVAAWASEHGAVGALARPRLLEHPSSRTVSEIRREELESPRKLIIKTVETRRSERKISDEIQGSQRVVTFDQEITRGVNVVVFRDDGLVEIRIGSFRGAAGDYRAQLGAMMKLIDGLSSSTLLPIHLTRAKQYLWEHRDALSGKIRYSSQLIRDDKGNTMAMSTGDRQANLFGETRVEDSVSRFIGVDEGYVDVFNVWWIAQRASGIPESDTHVLLSGDTHEFILTQQCDRETYEHILADIRRFNS